MLSRVGYALLPVGYMGVLYYFSSIPASELSQLGVRLPDKLLHASAYAILALLAYVALRRSCRMSSRAAGVFAWIVSVVYGVLDEFHQSYVPGRDPSLSDIVADALGAAVAIGLLTLVAARNRRGADLGTGSRRRP